MTKELKQKAEESAKQYMDKHTEKYNCENTKLETDNYNVGREQGYEDGFQDGAEFGYNKANEWHFVKDGDLPKRTYWVIVLYDGGKNWCKAKLEKYKVGVLWVDSGEIEIWLNDKGNKIEDVIAWKEIVLPKELAE